MVFGHTRAVKSHRTGRRRRKGGSRLPVAPWIVITLVCVLVASALTAGFVMLLRAGCSGDTYRVSVAAAGNVAGTLEDLAQDWEREQAPELDGECVGVSINPVSAVDASRGLTGQWNSVSLGDLPIAWVPDSVVWVDWVTGTEATADFFDEEPVLLGVSKTVLGVPAETAESLGWLGGAPPSWAEVLDAAEAGELRLAGASPRTSTEGLQSMLNAVSDGQGGVDMAEMGRYSEALEAGVLADSAEALFAAARDSEDPVGFADVYTALDYQVEEFNSGPDAGFELVSIMPSGAGLDAVYPYLVFDGGGAKWVSETDARIAQMFGDFLESSVAREAFDQDGIGPVDRAGGESGGIDGDTVREAVRQWQTLGQRSLNVLLVLDRSEAGGQESVSWNGEEVQVSDAEIRAAVSLLGELPSSSQVGLWEFGEGAGEGRNWEQVLELEELSDSHREEVEGALWNPSDLYAGGSPLFDTVTEAQSYLAERAVEGAQNVVLVLTNGGVDTVSAPTVEETAEALSSAAADSPVQVFTVGFGSADEGNLSLLAEAGGGRFIDPDGGSLLAELQAG